MLLLWLTADDAALVSSFVRKQRRRIKGTIFDKVAMVPEAQLFTKIQTEKCDSKNVLAASVAPSVKDIDHDSIHVPPRIIVGRSIINIKCSSTSLDFLPFINFVMFRFPIP